MDSKRNNMQDGVSSASDQLSTRLNLVTTLTHGFWLSYKSCCSTKHAPPHLNINFTQNRKPVISNLMKHPWSRELWHHQEVQPSALPHTSKAVKIRNNSLSLSIFTIISWSSQISQFHVHVHKCANSVPWGTPSLSTCSERLITTRTQIQFQICQEPRDQWRTPLFSKIIEGQTLYIPQRHSLDLSY